MESELIGVKYPALTWHTASHWQALHGCYWCHCGREAQRRRKLVQCVMRPPGGTSTQQADPRLPSGDTVGSALTPEASLSQLATSGQGLCGQRCPVLEASLASTHSMSAAYPHSLVKVKVVSDSLRPHGLYSPWNSPGQNTGVGSLTLLQGIFPTQGSNPGLLLCRWILCQLSHKGILTPLCDHQNCLQTLPGHALEGKIQPCSSLSHSVLETLASSKLLPLICISLPQNLRTCCFPQISAGLLLSFQSLLNYHHLRDSLFQTLSTQLPEYFYPTYH